MPLLNENKLIKDMHVEYLGEMNISTSVSRATLTSFMLK
jgi:hypothetical protein